MIIASGQPFHTSVPDLQAGGWSKLPRQRKLAKQHWGIGDGMVEELAVTAAIRGQGARRFLMVAGIRNDRAQVQQRALRQAFSSKSAS